MRIMVIILMMVPMLCQAVERDAYGRIARSRTEVARFKRMHPCPSTGLPYGACRGWVIDHVVPLACDGPDRVSNYQWQTTADAKAKDKWERRGCSKG